MGKQELFINHLSEAAHVTILGITNEHLSSLLEEALRRKRHRQGGGAFWSSIRVVFAGEPLLSIMHDELDAEYDKREESIRRRFQRAGQGRRAVASFLQLSNRPTQWSMHEYPYLLPFVGSMFELPDGSKVVQVATLRPSYRVADYLFLEFAETAGELAYFQAAFEDVVQHSVPQEEVVLAGRPLGTQPGFLCLGSRFRRSVMLPGRGQPSDWLPSVLVCTYSGQPGSTELLLQLRTRGNSSLEPGVLSHVSGFIYQHDTSESLTGQVEFPLPEEAAQNAAGRVVREELALTQRRLQLELVDHLRFHAVDHESLYFFVFALALPRSLRAFPPVSQIQPWALGDLLQLRKYQALSYAEEVLGKAALSVRQARLAGRVLRSNLLLHGLRELGEELMEHLYVGVRSPRLLREIRRFREESALEHPAAEGGRIRGLGRLQYREFFSSLLPLYARIGVPGAGEELAQVRDDPAKEAAVAELLRIYRGESSMRDLATEV
jgi:ADP-ribose pyrophosphatase YjhB (NUDIX family)